MPANPNLLVSPKQRQGYYYETLARDFVCENGLQLIVQNWQQPSVGELDLVCIETGHAWNTVVFVEVRKRKAAVFGDALASVTPAKQRKLIKTAHHFLQQHPQYAEMECRFDVVAFDNATCLEWVKGAFMASAW